MCHLPVLLNESLYVPTYRDFLNLSFSLSNWSFGFISALQLPYLVNIFSLVMNPVPPISLYLPVVLTALEWQVHLICSLPTAHQLIGMSHDHNDPFKAIPHPPNLFSTCSSLGKVSYSNLWYHLLFTVLTTGDIFYGMISTYRDSFFSRNFPTPSQGWKVRSQQSCLNKAKMGT